MVYRDSNGFTLIELLVVIAVLGILSSVVLVAINPQQRMAQARDALRKQHLGQIANALEAYYTFNRAYPGPCTRYAASGCNSATGGDNWIPGIVEGGYLKQLPKDPINSSFVSVWANGLSYWYVSENAGGGTATEYYMLGAFMENTSDPLTLGNLNTNHGSRPRWPNCSSSVGFNANNLVFRDYKCAADPPGAL